MTQAAIDTLRAWPTQVVRGNRAQGLIRELIELIDAEDSALELHRIYAALRAASNLAEGRSHDVEAQSREVEHARNSRPARRVRRANIRLV